MKHISIALVLPLLCAAPLPAMSQTGSQCTSIDDDAERLACFDAAFAPGAEVVPAQSVTLQSEQLIPARPSGRAPATITVSCEATGLQVAFGFAGNIMSIQGNDTGLTLQYDLQRARSSTLPVNGDNTAILIDEAGEAQAFVQGLEGATNLTVRVTPASTRSLNVRFNVSSFAQDVAPVVAACG